jgi:hypothetical protein
MSVSDLTHILHHSQEQAFRPVPQRVNVLVEQAGKPVHKKLIENGATSQLTNLTERRKFSNGLFNEFNREKEVGQRIV